MNYFEPDEIWSVFRIESQEDFLNKYVLKGKFHQYVPEKIVKDYKIVERLLCYSYFHSALIDEALSKSTRIFESSVTLRIENEGLKKKRFEGLNSKLKRLEKYCTPDLFAQWDWARETRNHFAHREAGVTMGIIALNALKHNLNMINSIFLSEDIILKRESEYSTLLSKSTFLDNGLFILEYQSKKILIQGAKPYCVGMLNTKNKSVWAFIPITGDKEINDVTDLPNPIILLLENIEFTSNGLYAIDSQDNQIITLLTTNKAENIKMLEAHRIRIFNLESLSKDTSSLYMALLKYDVQKKISDLLYKSW
jgi:hypothetical protein